MVKPRLSRPAYIQREVTCVARPFEYLRNFIPNKSLLQRANAPQAAGDNHPVVLGRASARNRYKSLHMLYRRILRRMALNLHKRNFHLERSVRKQTDQIGFVVIFNGIRFVIAIRADECPVAWHVKYR